MRSGKLFERLRYFIPLFSASLRLLVLVYHLWRRALLLKVLSGSQALKFSLGYRVIEDYSTLIVGQNVE